MPSKIASPIEPPATVVVTGANGFIAQHCIAALLKHGYHVVGTVRTASKADLVRKTHSSHPSLALVVVEDITSAQSYLAVLRPMSPSAILHLAAPFHYNAADFEQDLMIPAVRGSTAILEPAAEIKGVRRVVHTNSFACIYDAAAGPRPDKTYTARDWSPLMYRDGVQASNAPTAYRASKTAAEKAAWSFMEERKLGFDLVSLCPSMVFGPFLPESKPKTIEELNTSNLLVWSVVSAGQSSAVPPTKGPVWADVRDVADAHVRALGVPEAGGGRYLLCKDVYCNQELADVSRRVTSKYADRIPVGEEGRRERHTHFGVDASETERVLGIRWRGLEDCLGDLVPQLFEIERNQRA
ncbi:putative uncharacterized oxidoreductase [Tolypocladium ophioglossoides CBS 100239]|uniref:Uncharacterized oxidoreductase n=1 Tax=Tolypocladium ophioglossoides (strain CBS 100239) TaxID=1163406 RepID=A0A0L0MY63_TOLOC|nr:putative uncharacterized oxidoreductase [Tolypocladium ophioglossoides CBS 100239]